ncbi:N-acetylglucosamine kinase [Paenibacillus radicis (ex Xue et al. 2023)]|uniref:N-acetylglucosamine kinase n=1 Tax=Paenibacillus radicis (ex Xue et al. 2023) TaxID=2972489 RepID=A0ABT1YV61_9BACL|nr:BadF/BadG/BcrA/BcrD ATPase family protein [Paenibacillus radicis (ex Xue et al. 2023)]MCR8636837.1 N-acetylglucosamine kinase [Paenibacillus radicis (ex Xue et al. 2023)]
MLLNRVGLEQEQGQEQGREQGLEQGQEQEQEREVLKRQRFIGVDGGGTKTVCIIGDGCGNVLAVCSGDSSNIKSRPWDEVKQMLWTLVESALELSNSDESQLIHVYLGLAGADRPEDKQQFIDFFEGKFKSIVAVTVQNDAITALAAGTWGEAGIVLISGTGSIGYGYLPEMDTCVRVGGWGYLLGDEGSGFAIGQKALMAVMKQHDGRGRFTALTKLVLKEWSLPDPNRIITHVYSQSNVRTEVATISRLAVAAAKAGDEVACGIIAEAIEQLGELAVTAKLRLSELQPHFAMAGLPLVLSGGLFSDDWFMSLLQQHEDIQKSGLVISRLSLPPVAGCYVLALKQADVEITESVKQRIAAWETRREA